MNELATLLGVSRATAFRRARKHLTIALTTYPAHHTGGLGKNWYRRADVEQLLAAQRAGAAS